MEEEGSSFLHSIELRSMEVGMSPQIPDSHLALCSSSLMELLEVANGCALQTELKEFTGWVFVNLGVFIILPVFISVRQMSVVKTKMGSVSIIVTTCMTQNW